jgi:hypothetical protein
MGTEAVRFFVLWMAGWMHSRQLEVVDFLREENRRAGYLAHPGDNAAGVRLVAGLDRLPRLCSK